MPAAARAAAFSPDSALLYLAAGDRVALDTRSFEIRWREPLATTTNPQLDRRNGVVVSGAGIIVPSADGKQLFITLAFRGDTDGVAILNARTRDLVGFIGPFFAQGIFALPSGSSAPSGAILLFGRRAAYPLPRVDWLYTIDPTTLAVRDSAGIVEIPSGGNRNLVLPVLTSDRRYVYLMASTDTSDALIKYDLASQQVVASTPRQSDRAVAVTPDGQTLYEARQTFTADGPATEVLEYDGTLTLRGRITLPDVDGLPPLVLGAPAVSPDGRYLFLTAGTGSIVLANIIGGPRPGRLIAVDLTAQRVIWTTPLAIWAPGQVLVR